MNDKYKIRLNSGIGDCLRSISRQPGLDYMIKHKGVKIYWTYGMQTDAGWSDLLRNDILGRNQSFIYVAPSDFERLDYPELFSGSFGSHVFEDVDAYKKQGFDLKLNEKEVTLLNTLPIDSGHVNVGIQISGNDKHKHWPISNYVALINDLHERFHKVNIYIMDSPSKNFPSSGYDNSRVYNLIGKTSIAANINLIQKMDIWISPDSFSKYVAHWASVPQIIFCCKLPYIDPARMMKSCFNEVGIFHDSINQVVGIDFDSAGEISSCYDDIALIPYAKVWDSVVSLLNSIDKLK